jgi:CDP-diacylglycerol--glycerol-3-phosphate 3-phosphatidyltransferase
MMSLYELKPHFQALLRPACRVFARAGATANQVTIAAVILSAGAGGWIAADPLSPLPYLLLPIILFIRMSLNVIDGMLAHEFGMKSPLGGMLNELGDVVSDVVLYLPFGFHPAVPWWVIIALVLTSILAEMTGIVAVQIGASRRYDGPFGKGDRALAFALLGLLFGLGVPAGPWVLWYLLTALGLSALTALNRAQRALSEAVDAA